MKELTKAEEQVMQVLWELEKGFIRDLLEKFPEPKPAYTTISTIVRILEKKAFIDHRSYGKSHEYFPVISKEEYMAFSTNKLLKDYFGGSAKKMLSFFVKSQDINVEDLDKILKSIEEEE